MSSNYKPSYKDAVEYMSKHCIEGEKPSELQHSALVHFSAFLWDKPIINVASDVARKRQKIREGSDGRSR